MSNHTNFMLVLGIAATAMLRGADSDYTGNRPETLIQAIESITDDAAYAFLLDYVKQASNDDIQELYAYVSSFEATMQRYDNFLVANGEKILLITIIGGLLAMTLSLYFEDFFIRYVKYKEEQLSLRVAIRLWEQHNIVLNSEYHLTEDRLRIVFCRFKSALYEKKSFGRNFYTFVFGSAVTGILIGYCLYVIGMCMKLSGIQGEVDRNRTARIDNLLDILRATLSINDDPSRMPV